VRRTDVRFCCAWIRTSRQRHVADPHVVRNFGSIQPRMTFNTLLFPCFLTALKLVLNRTLSLNLMKEKRCGLTTRDGHNSDVKATSTSSYIVITLISYQSCLELLQTCIVKQSCRCTKHSSKVKRREALSFAIRKYIQKIYRSLINKVKLINNKLIINLINKIKLMDWTFHISLIIKNFVRLYK